MTFKLGNKTCVLINAKLTIAAKKYNSDYKNTFKIKFVLAKIYRVRSIHFVFIQGVKAFKIKINLVHFSAVNIQYRAN